VGDPRFGSFPENWFSGASLEKVLTQRTIQISDLSADAGRVLWPF
jgi:hypothetical protein